MLSGNGIAPPIQRVSLPVSFGLVGQVAGVVDDGAPACPTCGGELLLCQPDMDDETGAQLAGACLECRRLALVVEFPDGVQGSRLPMRVALALPSREEIAITMANAQAGC